jgi:antitoxin VapB
MGAQLKIDSDETYGLAAELASLRGESIESVVTTALRDALKRDRAARKCAETQRRDEIEYQELREIVDDIHRHLRHPLPGSDHSWLYDDETGLPR